MMIVFNKDLYFTEKTQFLKRQALTLHCTGKISNTPTREGTRPDSSSFSASSENQRNPKHPIYTRRSSIRSQTTGLENKQV